MKQGLFMENPRPTGMRAFTIVWLGQFVSILGTSMTQFALTIWSWRFVTEIQPVADPATAYALVGVSNYLPQVLFSPIAGVLVDRWNRKLTMMLVDLAAGISTIAIFLLYLTGELQIWHLYVAGAFTGIFQSFHFPAYSAAISTMVPKAQYARADALLGLAESIPFILAPIFASFLLGVISIAGVMVIDIVTFTAAVIALLLVHIPQPAMTQAGAESRKSFWVEITYGFRYIFARPSLLGLQLVFLFGNLLHGLSMSLQAPMILSRTGNSETTLGIVQAAMGIGGVVGGVIMASTGGLKRRVHGVLGGWIITSILSTMLFGIGQGLIPWLIAAFVGAFIGISVINASNQAIWQSKVEPDVQGRVFGVRRLIAQIVGPLGMILSGPLADRLFEPAMQTDGMWAGTFGWLVGTGSGAGMALMMVIAGAITVLVGVIGYSIPAIRNVEDILPDHEAKTVDDPVGEVMADAPAVAS
jgi:DHA3 family macrolide efflux protein-like MFS transporter